MPQALYYLQIAAPYAAAAALLIALGCALGMLLLRRRLKRLALGRAGSLEESIGILTRDTKDLLQFRTELERYLKLAEVRLRGSVAGTGLVRFNPFEGQGQGGNQSFAAAFLDEGGKGVVLSSLYARSQLGVYAKPVENWTSTYELTQEEKSAIAQAKEQIASRKKSS